MSTSRALDPPPAAGGLAQAGPGTTVLRRPHRRSWRRALRRDWQLYTLAIAPLLYDAGTAYTQLLLVTPFALRRWPEVVAHWRNDRRYAFGVAVLAPIAYVLVLTAMSFTPVSYVAPAREVSIVIGAFLGARVLKEGESRKRIVAAVVMAAGVIALALG